MIGRASIDVPLDDEIVEEGTAADVDRDPDLDRRPHEIESPDVG